MAGAVGDQAHLAEGHDEHGVVSHQCDVSAHDQRGAGTGDGTVSSSDDGLGEGVEQGGELAGNGHEVEEGGLSVDGLHLSDVATSAESAALAVHHDAADSSVVLCGVKGGGQIGEDLLVQRVHSLGAVQADVGNGALNAIQYGFQCHW